MASLPLQVAILLLLILVNGLLAMSEIAVVSARRAVLQRAADEGDAGAAEALKLAGMPGRFLSTIQIGITLIGILIGAVGSATIARQLVVYFERVPALAPYAESVSVALVVVLTTYLSLVLGELAPKRMGLSYPEGVARRMARPLSLLSRLSSPVVHLLSASTDGLLRLLRVPLVDEQIVTEDEVRLLLQEGARTGVFEPIEEEIVRQVFRLSDRKVTALLTPRLEIIWFNIDDTPAEIRRKISESGHSAFPVARENLDNILGVVAVKELITQTLNNQPLSLSDAMRPALFVPESMPALTLLERFRQQQTKIALVIDEFGGLLGLVTLNDILEAIVGELPEPGDEEEAEAIQRDDGSWLLDGMFSLDEFQEMFDIDTLPEEIEDYYNTVGGLVMAVLGRVPSTGDILHLRNLRIEVVDMDGRRVDKVLVAPEQPEEGAA